MKLWVTLSLVTLLSALLSSGSAQTQHIYKAVGEAVVLKPPNLPSPIIKSVLWKHNGNLAVEWEGNEVIRYTHFEGKSSINNLTGELTLEKLTEVFNGFYTVEISDISVPGNISLKVLSPVPKPHISSSCNDEKTLCTLTCEANVTAMQPQPSYVWKFNNTEKPQSSPDLQITKENTANEFICELKNPVSHESSEPFADPFTSSTSSSETGGLKINTALVVFACLLGLVIAVVLVHRVKSGMFFFQKDSMPWEADFWKKTESHAAPPPTQNNEQPGERNAMVDSC